LSGLLVEGDVEVDADEDSFSGDIEILDGAYSHGDFLLVVRPDPGGA
jgi:hypothetical protein